MNMRKNVFNLLVCAAAAAMIIGCGNGARKAAAEAEAAAEQARLDSVEAAQKAEKAKEIMETIANLPEEPVFDIVTNLGTIKVKLTARPRSIARTSRNWLWKATMTAFSSTG